jgi:hypothetical protein
VGITYPSEPMMMWPISTRVNKPENDNPSQVDRGAIDIRPLERHLLAPMAGNGGLAQ